MQGSLRQPSVWQHLEGLDVILGSQSPRRVELLEGLGIAFRQEAMPDLDESYPLDLSLPLVARFIAESKARAYAERMTPSTLLITADTTVLVGEELLGKPYDLEDARRMLRSLSGRTHQVITGVCVSLGALSTSFDATTLVHFDELSDADIAYYTEHYCPLDKAGAYGIQEWIGYRGIRGIEGSFYNVMGLPVHQLARVLTNIRP